MSIQCKLCNQSFHNAKCLFHHLHSTHGVDKNEYVKGNFSDFVPFGWKRCEECGIPFRGKSNRCGKCYTKLFSSQKNPYIVCKHCNSPVHSKVMPVHLKVHHGVEFLDYVEENLMDFGRFGWARCHVCGRITKKRGDKHPPTCSIECSAAYKRTLTGEKSHAYGFRHTQETKDRIGGANNHPNPMIAGDNNPAKREKVREKISKTRIERGVSKGERNPMFGKTHTPEAIKKIFAHKKMNRLEKLFADELDRLGIKYVFQFFISNGEVCKSYDFKIKKEPVIIEVDGDYWHGNPETKSHCRGVGSVKENDIIKEQMANDRGYQVIRFWEADIKKNISVVSEKLKQVGLIGGE